MKLVTSIVQKAIGAILTALIPRNLKRITLLTTMYHRMVGDKGLELSALKELDEALQLTRTHDPKSLVLLGKLDNAVWGNLDCDLLHANKDSLVKDVLRRTPCWLIYARRDDIIQDIRNLQQLVACNPLYTQA